MLVLYFEDLLLLGQFICIKSFRIFLREFSSLQKIRRLLVSDAECGVDLL